MNPLPDRRLSCLSLSTVFPNPTEPGCGIFVERRLEALASLPDGPDVKVIAPVQVFDWGNRRHRFLRSRGVAWRRTQGPLEVFHPTWFYPPRGGAANAGFLAARIVLTAARLWTSGYRFDLIDAHFGHPEGVAAAVLGRLFQRPFLITMRGNEPLFAAAPSIRATQKWAFGRAARVIGVSRALSGFAESLGVARERSATIPNGVDGALYHPRDRAACREKHRIPAGSRMLLSAGYLVEGKGHHDIVRAVAKLRSQGLPLELWIAGGPGREGDFEPAIRAAIAETGLGSSVRMIGAVPPTVLAELMSAADVLCLASYAEGWPNVVHEAMACGAPVVASSVGGVPEMIPDDVAGIVIPPRDAAALAEALRAAFSRQWDRAAIARMGRERTWTRVAGEVHRLMKDVAAEIGG